MKKENAAQQDHRGKWAFEEAKEAFLAALFCHADVSLACTKLFGMLALRYANRKHFERTGELLAWPSYRTLNEEIGMHRPRIGRAVKEAERLGLVNVIRPEKRGPSHHYQYILIAIDGSAGGANSTRSGCSANFRKIGSGDVANCETPIGSGHGANIGSTGGAVLAPAMEPDSSDNLPDGAGALSRPSPDLPEQGAGTFDLIDESDKGLEALDAPPPFSTDLDSWRGLPEFATEDSVRARGALGRAPVPDEDPDRAELETILQAAASEFAKIHPDAEICMSAYVSDILDGFLGGEPDALDRFRRASVSLLVGVPRAGEDRAAPHLIVLERFAATFWGRPAARQKAAEFAQAFCAGSAKLMKAAHG